MYAISKINLGNFAKNFIKTGKARIEYINIDGDTALTTTFKAIGPIITNPVNRQQQFQQELQIELVQLALLLIKSGKINIAQENIEGKRAYEYALENGLSKLEKTTRNSHLKNTINEIMNILSSEQGRVPPPPRQNNPTPPPPPPPPRPTPPIPEPVTNTSPPVSTTTESNGRQCPSEGKEPTIIQNDKDYRLQTRIFHPDKNRDCQREAHEKMQKLNTMYQNYQKLNPRGGKHKKSKRSRKYSKSKKNKKTSKKYRKTIKRV